LTDPEGTACAVCAHRYEAHIFDPDDTTMICADCEADGHGLTIAGHVFQYDEEER
jgi:hypothetical protein